MTWDKITVQQFQQLHALGLQEDMDPIDRVRDMICILYGYSPEEVDDMQLGKYNQLAREGGEFLKMEVPGKAVKRIRIGTKLFAIQYDPAKLKHRQNVETLTYGREMIPNLHRLMASIVEPVRWGIRRANKVEDHEATATLMLQAPITVVYHTALFFCRLYSMSIKAIKPVMMREMMAAGQTEAEALSKLDYLEKFTDGLTQPKEWQALSASL